jgi:outer membrane protein
MRHHLRNLLCATLLLSLVAPAASAADFKVGVVDVEYVVLNSKRGKSAKKKLKKIFDKKQASLDKKQTKLLEMKKQLENPSAMQSQDQLRAIAQEYQKGVMELQEAFVKNQQGIAKKEIELMQPILEELEKVLEKIANSEKLDLIMNRSQQGVIFAKPALDITQKVLKALDKKR